jgi:hypothetical protein
MTEAPPPTEWSATSPAPKRHLTRTGAPFRTDWSATSPALERHLTRTGAPPPTEGSAAEGEGSVRCGGSAATFTYLRTSAAPAAQDQPPADLGNVNAKRTSSRAAGRSGASRSNWTSHHMSMRRSPSPGSKMGRVVASTSR